MFNFGLEKRSFCILTFDSLNERWIVENQFYEYSSLCFCWNRLRCLFPSFCNFGTLKLYSAPTCVANFKLKIGLCLSITTVGSNLHACLLVIRALSAWYDGREWFNSLCKHVMEQDWSWNRPALDYLELYHAARKWGKLKFCTGLVAQLQFDINSTQIWHLRKRTVCNLFNYGLVLVLFIFRWVTIKLARKKKTIMINLTNMNSLVFACPLVL